MENFEYSIGDVVQITNPEHAWYPCLITLTRVDNKLMGYATSPSVHGQAYIFLKYLDIEYVGKAAIVAGEEGI